MESVVAAAALVVVVELGWREVDFVMTVDIMGDMALVAVAVLGEQGMVDERRGGSQIIEIGVGMNDGIGIDMEDGMTGGMIGEIVIGGAVIERILFI